MFLLSDSLDSKNKQLIIWKEELVTKIYVPEEQEKKYRVQKEESDDPGWREHPENGRRSG